MLFTKMILFGGNILNSKQPLLVFACSGSKGKYDDGPPSHFPTTHYLYSYLATSLFTWLTCKAHKPRWRSSLHTVPIVLSQNQNHS